MANVFGTLKDAGQWVSMEFLALLESKRSVSQFFNTDFSKEFKQKFPVAESISVQYPMQYAIRNGLEYDPPAANRRYATINIGEPFGVDLPEIDSLENALMTPRSRDKFAELYLDPASTQLAQEIDSRCALFAYQNAAGVVGALGTDPTTVDDTSAAARQKLQELGAPAGERGMLIPPAVMRAVKASNASLFNPVTDISKMFRDGILSHADGFDWYESMSLYRHTAGTWATAVTVTTAPANGATSVVLTCTTGDTFKKGDKIAFGSVLPVHPLTKRTFGAAEKTFTITADVTGAGSAATISVSPAIYFSGPYQNVDSQPLAAAALTLWPGTTSPNGKVGNVGLALPKNAFALVGLELEEFTDVEMCSQKRDPDSGIAVRFIAASDPRASKRIRRFDVCIGFGNFYNDLAHVVACG